jgi:purine-binding chemotaxis protein CheW
MDRERDDVWQALARSGEPVATEEAYEHGYQREVRKDLRKYVAFRVSNEVYALPIDELHEISMLIATTPVPGTAEFVLGIGNVRGDVIPIVDLPTRLGLHVRERSRSTRVLIVKHEGERYGLVVDEVLEVVSLAPEELEDAPGAISGPRSEFIAALGRYRGDILIVLDLAPMLDPREFVPILLGRGRVSP